MRIAVFYHLPFGGAKRVVQEHVRGLVLRGHEVDLYTTVKEYDAFDPGIFASHEYIFPFTILSVRLPLIGRLLKDYTVFNLLKKHHKKIAEEIDKKGYDIVLVHSDIYTQSPFILQFLHTRNVYFCLEPLRIAYEYCLRFPDNTAIANRIYESISRHIRKNIDRSNAQSADYTLAISLFGREYMIHAFNLYPVISYLGVDEKRFHPLKLKKKKQILFVAEKEYIYGYDLIEKAMRLIPEQKRPLLKFVFGTKKEQRINDKDLVHLYNESLVTLSLSRYDTFGLVPLESMACGVPVIALNVAGYRETIVDNKTGFLVDFDPEAIAEKIMLFLDNPSLSKQMGDEGRKWIEAKWTWNEQIRNLENHLISLTKLKKFSDTD